MVQEARAEIGIIGGSGFYEMPGLEGLQDLHLHTPYGEPSSAITLGTLGGRRVAFIARHDEGHRIMPAELPSRANIYALKRLGVTHVIGVSAVGSLREELAPGTFVVVDQFIDRTFARNKSFFGTGCVAHVSVAEPVCRRLGDRLQAAAREAGIDAVRGGTYLVMEGPQFSTKAESALYRSWGCDVIGMTNMPEAKLAREAEICYATVAMVTDYDCWHPDHDHVTVETVVQVLLGNAEKARSLVRHVVPALSDRTGPCEAGCHRALDAAIITPPDARDPDLVVQLDAVAGRVLRTNR